MGSKRLIVFDMDGVLIDVSRSYRDTVRQTARLFFKGARSWEDLPDPLFHLSDLARVKQSGGLNNDWDLSCFIITLLFSLVKTSTIHEDPDTWQRYQKTIKHSDVTELAGFLHSTNRPVTMLLEKKGKISDTFVMSLYDDDVGSGNIIKQIFQEIYLGKDLFESIYGMPPKVYNGEGFIKRENLLVKKSFLKYLSKNNILAVATGRPKAEAEYPLDFFNLREYFEIIFTLDDCIREEKKILKHKGKKVSISKPNPYILDAIAEIYKHETSGFYYIGDMPDDMVAASRSRAGFTGIGLLTSSPDKADLKKTLLKAGAVYIIDNLEELKEIIEMGKKKNRWY
jgi:HAD superfamily hydrolase (TIGR01548 family)